MLKGFLGFIIGVLFTIVSSFVVWAIGCVVDEGIYSEYSNVIENLRRKLLQKGVIK